MRSYTQQIEHVWTLRQSGALSIYEHDLYLYLLNTGYWLKTHSFPLSPKHLVENLGMSKNAIVPRRTVLTALGLISTKLGRGRSCGTVYTLLGVNVLGEQGTGSKWSAFEPPTFGEVQDYCKERNSAIDATRFYAYYQAKDWRMGKSKMDDWRRTVQMWEATERKPQSVNMHSGAKHKNTLEYEQF